jgi:hypothetical protein
LEGLEHLLETITRPGRVASEDGEQVDAAETDDEVVNAGGRTVRPANDSLSRTLGGSGVNLSHGLGTDVALA